MLQLLDESLESFLRAEVPLGREEVDVAFDIPDPDWGGGLTKPTVNMYLWDVRRSASQNEAGKVLKERNGEKVWTDPMPRIAFRYMVSAWANEVRDEHQLLGALLTALLPSAALPREHLQGDLAREENDFRTARDAYRVSQESFLEAAALREATRDRDASS